MKTTNKIDTKIHELTCKSTEFGHVWVETVDLYRSPHFATRAEADQWMADQEAKEIVKRIMNVDPTDQ